MKHQWKRTDNGKFMVLNGNQSYVISNRRTFKGWLWVADKVMGYEETTFTAREWVEAFYELKAGE